MLWVGGGGTCRVGENVTGDVERGRFRAVGRSGSARLAPRGCVGGWTMLYGPYRGVEDSKHDSKHTERTTLVLSLFALSIV